MDPTLAGLIDGIPPERLAIAAAAAALLALVLLVALGVQLGKRRRAQRAAAEARGHLRTVTATMREGVVAYDMKLRLTFVNPAFERLTGYPEEDLRDQEFLQYIHPDDRPALIAEWERLAAGRLAPRPGVPRGHPRRAGALVLQLLGAAARRSGRQIGYLGTEFDITERKLAEEAMRLDTELFQAMIEVQQAVAAAGLDSQTVMRVIADRGLRLTGASGAVIESIEGDELVPQVHIGVSAPRLRLANSLSGLCVRTGELQRSDDVLNDPRIGHDAYRELGDPVAARGAAERRAAHPRRAQGRVQPPPGLHRPRREGAPAAGRADGRGAGARRRVRGPAAAAGGADPGAPGERAAVQAAGGRRRRKASGWRTTAA